MSEYGLTVPNPSMFPPIPTIAHEMGMTPPQGPLPSTEEALRVAGTKNMGDLVRGLMSNNEKQVEEAMGQITARLAAAASGSMVTPDDVDIDVDLSVHTDPWYSRVWNDLKKVGHIITYPFELASFKFQEWWANQKENETLTYKVLSYIAGILAFCGTAAIVFGVCMILFQWITVFLINQSWLVLV